MKNLLISICLIFLSFKALAGTEVGNGGVGIMVHDQIQVFDLFENDKTVVSDFKTDSKKQSIFKRQIELQLDPKLFPTDLIAAKITNVSIRFPVLAQVLVGVINLYEWNFTEADLSFLSHDFQSAIDTKGLQLVQIADRQFNTILMSKKSWNLMAPQQRMALVFHEVFYSIILSGASESSQIDAKFLNLRSRNVNSYFLSHDLSAKPEMTKSFLKYDFVEPETENGLVFGRIKNQNYEVYYSPVIMLADSKGPIATQAFGEKIDFKSVCNHLKNESITISLVAPSLAVSADFSFVKAVVTIGYYSDSILTWQVLPRQSQSCELEIAKILRSYTADYFN